MPVRRVVAVVVLALTFALASAGAAEAVGKPHDKGGPPFDAHPGKDPKGRHAVAPEPAPEPVAQPAPQPAAEPAEAPQPAAESQPRASPEPEPQPEATPEPAAQEAPAETTAPEEAHAPVPIDDAPTESPYPDQPIRAPTFATTAASLEGLVEAAIADDGPQESLLSTSIRDPTISVGRVLPWVAILGAAGLVLALRTRATPTLVEQPRRHPMAPVAPGDVDGMLLNGKAASERGDLDEALAWFEQATRAAPKLGIAHFCRGICLGGLGRAAEGFDALREAVRCAPAEWGWRVHLARFGAALGRTADAMDALGPVARDHPELCDKMIDDPQLAALRDHPRFLAMMGRL